MGIYDDVNAAIKDAMRAQDKQRLAGLRGIRAGFILGLKEDGSQTLSDEKCVEILRRLAKQRADSIEAYAAGGRQDLVDAEKAELAVIEEYLPRLADEATVRVWVQEAIAATGASDRSATGKVMGYVMGRHKGEADGKLVKQVVGELLG